VPVTTPIAVPALLGLSMGTLVLLPVRVTDPTRVMRPVQVLVPDWLTRAPCGIAPPAEFPKPVPLRVTFTPTTVTPPCTCKVAPEETVAALPVAEARPSAAPLVTVSTPLATVVPPV
jgi:hypothetical protein